MNYNIIPSDENTFEFRIGADSTVEILESAGGSHVEVETDRPELFRITADGRHFSIGRIDQPDLGDFISAVIGFVRNRDASGLKKFGQERASVSIRIFTDAGTLNIKALNSSVLVRKDLDQLRLKSSNLSLRNEGLIRNLDLKASNGAMELNLGRTVSSWQIKACNSSIRLNANGFDGEIRSSVRGGTGCVRPAGGGKGLVSITAINGNVTIG